MTADKLANLAGFQVGWLAAVIGAAHGYPWLGAGYAMGWLTWHLSRQGRAAGVELRLLLAAAVLGYAADSLLVLTGVMAFPPIARLGAPSTLWMVALWMMFAATLRHSLGWLRGRPALAVVFGAGGGPLAYWAGSRLDALVLSDAASSLLAIAVVWGLATPLLLALACRLEDRSGGRRGFSGERA